MKIHIMLMLGSGNIHSIQLAATAVLHYYNIAILPPGRFSGKFVKISAPVSKFYTD